MGRLSSGNLEEEIGGNHLNYMVSAPQLGKWRKLARPDHEPPYHPFMQQNVRTAARKVTIADVSPAGVVLHFDNGISVHYSSEFLWRNREVSGNKILPEPPSDE
jgi:hypothetical protein